MPLHGVAFLASSPFTTTYISRRSFCARPRNALRVTLGRYRGRITQCSAAGGSRGGADLSTVKFKQPKDEDEDALPDSHHSVTEPCRR
eukprot:IDg1563t1